MVERHHEPGSEFDLNQREMEILTAVLQNYLGTGEPVGSRLLSEQGGSALSPASIRHVLAVLEDKGYLFQPHTSAGRVPTLQALRLFVRHLPAASLETVEAARIEHQLLHAQDWPALFAQATQFLSAVSEQMGMVAVTPWPDPGVKQMRFIRLTERRVLAVLISADGQIRERVSRIPEAYSQEELDAAAAYLNQSFSGFTLSRIRRELVRRIEEERAAYDRLLRRVLVLYHCGVLEMQDTGQVYLEGASNLASLLRDSERLAGILEALTEKQKLLDLLTGFSEGGVELGEDGAILVRIGLENEAMPEFSLITAHYQAPDQTRGAIGILGPTRMRYDRAVAAVSVVRSVFSRVVQDSLYGTI